MTQRADLELVLHGVVETPAEDRLRELGEVIRREHEAAVKAAVSMVEHAIACGEALFEAKLLVPRMEWSKWIEDNLPFDRRSSMLRHYMRLAALKDHVDPTLSITSNLQALRGLPPHTIGSPRVDPEIKAEAMRLWETGQFTRQEIARRVGVTKATMSDWTDPAARKRRQDRSNRRRQERIVAKRLAAMPDDADDADRQRYERVFRYGEPGRAAIGQAVRRLAQVQGKEQTHEALLDIAAICIAWSERLAAQGAVTLEQAA